MTAKSPLTYADAGVDIDAGNELVERIKPRVARTFREGVLTGLGGFGALFELDTSRYRQPVLVAATDGVGTKLKLALELNKHDTVGIDLVAMCANDLVVQGAEPLFFLDYYATGKLDVDVAADVVAGIAAGCEQAGAALIGGETAELPGMYHGDDYDLAGFCVGVVEKDRILSPEAVTEGDVLLGIASSGPHSNGYSLIRKLLDTSGESRSMGAELLTPTRIYVESLLALNAALPVHALAHITGGGLLENIPRSLPDHLAAVVDLDSWPTPAVFEWLQETGAIATGEMLRTFNCGVGMVVILPERSVADAVALLADHGDRAWPMGRVEARTDDPIRFERDARPLAL